MRHTITTYLSLTRALTTSSAGDTIVCPSEAMKMVGEKGRTRLCPDKELIFEVPRDDSEAVAIRRNFADLRQLVQNFPTAFEMAAIEDMVIAQSLDNLVICVRKWLEALAQRETQQ